MRRILMITGCAAALALMSGADAGAAGPGGARARSAAEALGLVQNVARVCRDVCRDGFCRRRCWEEPEYRERRVYREYDYDDDPPPARVYPRYDRGPGVGIYAPGIGGIGVGPGW